LKEKSRLKQAYIGQAEGEVRTVGRRNQGTQISFNFPRKKEARRNSQEKGEGENDMCGKGGKINLSFGST